MLIVNGVDATSGEYLLPPMTEREVSRAVLEEAPDPRITAALRARHRRQTEDHLAPRFGIDDTDLAQTGWAVVLPSHADPGLLSALRPLLDHRRSQASAASERFYRELTGDLGYRPGESKDDFLGRHGAGPGPVRPEVLPYYILLVGGPDEIPFEFQYQLGVQHAVGRLSFDELDQYAHYARNVVVAETRAADSGRAFRFSVFAPSVERDAATTMSAQQLALPVADALETGAGWSVARLVAEDAHKAQLLAHLSGPDRPDLLLSASHGVGFPAGHPKQRESQGALLCQDWPGPGGGPIAADQYLAGEDVDDRSAIDLTGMVAVCFACFGAGTPRYDGFARPGRGTVELSARPFIAALPQTMLGREHGALAVVGHIDRAWSYSFSWPGAGAQTEVFRSLLARIGDGAPLGAAMSYLTDRYAEVASELALAIEQVRLGRRPRDEQIAGMWTAYADARGFVVLGDPAVAVNGRQRRTDPAPSRDVGRRPAAQQESPTTPIGPPRDVSGSPARPVPEPVGLSATPDRAPIQVATYVAKDPTQVAVDPDTGCIHGAELALLSYVDPDGTARHVVADALAADDEGRAAHQSVVDIHARLLEVSLAAQRDRVAEPTLDGAP